MSNLTVAQAQAALLAAQKAERKVIKPLRYVQIVPDYDPAGESLASALAYKATLIQTVNEIDNKLVALANEGNVKFKAIVERISGWSKLIPNASEKEYQELLAQIAAAESDAGMLKLTDYKVGYAYSDLKKQRNVAISALSAHIQILEALESVI